MKRLAILITLAGLIVLFSVPAVAAIINVPADETTIQDAVTAASAGDTIIVAAGTYAEGVTVPAGKNGLLIHGANAGVAAGRVPAARGAESIVDGGFSLSSDGVVIDGFRIDNGASLFGAGSIGGVTIATGTADVIKNNIFVGNGSACLYPAVHHAAAAGGGHLVQNNEMSGWCQGVILNPSTGIVIEENNMHDNDVGVGSDGQNDLLIQFNRFADHSFVEAVGMGSIGTGVVINNNNLEGGDNINHYGPSGAAVDAERNYYGCEEGPGNAGCSTMAGGSFPADVDFSPWLCTAYPDGTDTNDMSGVACPTVPLPMMSPAAIALLGFGLMGLLAFGISRRARRTA